MIKIVALRYAEDFERKVNRLLSQGWRLNQPIEMTGQLFYAFLIKDATLDA